MSPSPEVDRVIDVRRFAPTRPALLWGVLTAAALGGAAVVVLRATPTAAPAVQMISAGQQSDIERLGRDVRRLAAERDALAQRLASLERGFGELKLAARAAQGPDTTGSVSRAAAPASPAPGTTPRPPAFAIALGPDAAPDALRRRWTTLAARYPQTLAKLSPRAARSALGSGVFDLVAGPFATSGEALRACADLAKEGLSCDTTTYAGDPLDRL